MSSADAIAQEGRHRLLAFTLSYAAWFGALIMQQSGWFPGRTQTVLGAVAGLLGLIWLLCMAWFWRWGRRVRKQPELLAPLNDELTVRNRWRAQRASAFVLLVCLMLGVGITSVADISGRLAMLMLLWVLVVSQLGFYLWFDGEQ